MVSLNLGEIAGGAFSGIARTSTAFFIGVGVLILVSIIGWFVWKWYQNIAFYRTPVSLTIILDNGTEKTRHDLRGAVFMNRGVRDFKIKIPKTRKPQILGYIPDMSLADADGRLKFITSGDRTIWQQYQSSWKLKERVIDKEGNLVEYDLVNKPVPRETKQLTINSMRNWRETIDKQKLTVFGIAIGGLIILVIAHLISLFIQTRIRCAV